MYFLSKMIPPFRAKLILFDTVSILYERNGDLCFWKSVDFLCALTKFSKNDIIQAKIRNSKGENDMKWIILGVVFGVVAVIRGNGIAFFD